MRFLFISEDLIAGNLTRLLQQEGHEVKLCILEQGRQENFKNLVPKVASWEEELHWVGEDGIIVFDYVGDGELQDSLREKGYSVFGGGKLGEDLEVERGSTQTLFEKCEMDTSPIFDFSSLDEAISFIEANPSAWVIKKNNVATNSVNYIGKLEDGTDVIDVLRSYKIHNQNNTEKITLQKRIDGVEIAVARYFNGKTWVSPIEINIEHNPFLSGDIGLSTSEMGTICWHTQNEENTLFQKTLARIQPYLEEIDYRGVIDINCIVNEDGIYPLEATARFGSPICHLQSEMLLSGWGNLIAACARSTEYMSEWKKGYGIVVFVTTPPFPYSKDLAEYNPKGQKIYFLNDTEDNFKHVHFEDVSGTAGVDNNYVISDTRGYILYVTACETDMLLAQETVYKRIEKIYFPKMMYRNDIGTKFIEKDKTFLEKCGYLN